MFRRGVAGLDRNLAVCLRTLFIAAALLASPLAGLTLNSARASEIPSPRYFSVESGHTIGDPFLGRWIVDGGAATLGNPISEPVTLEGKTVQFFEYGALAQQSEIARLPVAAMLLAHDVRAHSPGNGHRSPSPIDSAGGQRAAANAGQEGVVSIDATNLTVSGSLLGYYRDHGGDGRFGAPISQPYRTGGVTVQWFEFGRIELAKSGVAISAPVGFELARRLGVDMARVDQGGLPLFLASRIATFHGDGAVPNAQGVFEPVEIKIPAISVDAKIERVSIVDGAMGTPEDAWNVGWYPQLSWPGEYTNVVMAGHRDWWGIGPTVFYDLPNLTAGDMIYLVGADGAGATYRITDAYSVGSETNAGDIVGDTGGEMLTLITCDGSFDGAEYASRQIIRAQRI